MATIHAPSDAVRPSRGRWFKTALVTAVVSIIAVLAAQAAALAVWPEIALFPPLDSYARSAVFTLVPALAATAILAWLVAHKPRPMQTFVRISVFVLLLSIIPDYLAPVPNKTLLASTVAAGLHIVAAATTVLVLARSYPRQAP